jgi:hypothetical protein
MNFGIFITAPTWVPVHPRSYQLLRICLCISSIVNQMLAMGLATTSLPCKLPPILKFHLGYGLSPFLWCSHLAASLHHSASVKTNPLAVSPTTLKDPLKLYHTHTHTHTHTRSSYYTPPPKRNILQWLRLSSN